MQTYKIEYNGKTRNLKADSATQAAEKFAGLQVFGQPMIPGGITLKMFDADTRGQQWAEYKAGWENERTLSVELAQ